MNHYLKIFFFVFLFNITNSFSQSLLLTTSPQWVAIGDLDVAGTQLTVEALVYRTGGIDVLSKHTGPADVNYLLRLNTFELTTTSGFYLMTNPFVMNNNQWYHIAGTYDGTNIKYYVNGCLIITQPASGNLITQNLISSIGNVSCCGNEQFYGNIDELRIWNVARTQAQIQTNMNNLPTPAIQLGLLSYYKFNNNLINSQGNATYNGTRQGAVVTYGIEHPAILTSTITSVVPQNAFCANNNGLVIINATGTGLLYSIDNTNFFASSTFTSLAVGNYTASIQTIEGCKQQQSFSILLAPSLSLTVNGNTNICQNQSTTLTCSGASSYTWNPSGSLNSAFTSTVVASPTITTIYDVIGAAGSCTAAITVTVSVNPTPTITVTANPSTICLGGSATLTAAGANTYTWSPTLNLNTSNGAIVVATPSTITNYTVIASALSCTNIAIITISVSPNSALNISASSLTICNGGSSTLTVNGSSSYSWSPSLTLSSNTGSVVTATPVTTTSYNVVGQNALGCISNTVVIITIGTTAIITISPSTSTICIGDNKLLIANGASTYNWEPEISLNRFIGSSVIGSPTITTTYTVIGSTGVCTSSATAIVNVVSPLLISVVASPSLICTSKSTTLTASGGITYTWSPEPTLSSATSPITISTPNSTKTFTVSATDALGCSSSSTVLVIVVQTPTLSLSATSLTICEGTNTNLEISGASNYLWSPSTTLSSSTASNVIASPRISTLYVVIGNNNICTDVKSIQINVLPKIIPTITPNDTSICFGESLQLIAGGGNKYNWSPSMFLSTSTNSVVTTKPTTTIIYSVSVSNNYNTCTQNKSIRITVNPLPIVNAGKDSTINIDETITLTGSGDGIFGYKSLTGNNLLCNYCPEITVAPKESTCYLLHSINNFGCENTDAVCIKITKDYDIYIPNAFTPNNDIYNENFIPVGYGLAEIKLFIFNRWGVQIFRSIDNIIGWDGKNKGELCEQGVYSYQVDFKTLSGRTEQRVGQVLLLSKIK